MPIAETRKLNIDAIASVIGYLLLFPENHDQDSWYAGLPNFFQTAEQLRRPKCGTTMCLAGWATSLFAPDRAIFSGGENVYLPDPNGEFFVFGKTEGYYDEVSVESYAREVLGLTHEQAFTLFYTLTNEEIIPALRYIVGNPDAEDWEICEEVGHEE